MLRAGNIDKHFGYVLLIASAVINIETFSSDKRLCFLSTGANGRLFCVTQLYQPGVRCDVTVIRASGEESLNSVP